MVLMLVRLCVCIWLRRNISWPLLGVVFGARNHHGQWSIRVSIRWHCCCVVAPFWWRWSYSFRWCWCRFIYDFFRVLWWCILLLLLFPRWNWERKLSLVSQNCWINSWNLKNKNAIYLFRNIWQLQWIFTRFAARVFNHCASVLQRSSFAAAVHG